MKKTRSLLVCAAIAALAATTACVFFSCERSEKTWRNEDIECNPLIYIYKFKPGKDYSEQASHYMYYPGDDCAFRDVLGCRPMPLHNGYYTGGNIWYAPPEYAAFKTAYLTITLDELEGNDSVYYEWYNHWENYILDEDPFMEFYYYTGCNEELHLPISDSGIAGYELYHHEYAAQMFDSTTLNNIIDDCQLEKYLIRVK